MAGKVYRLGDEPGIGSTVKAVNQLLAGVHIATAAEAMAFGTRAGADPRTLFEVISNSAGNSWMFGNRVPHMLDGDYTPALGGRHLRQGSGPGARRRPRAALPAAAGGRGAPAVPDGGGGRARPRGRCRGGQGVRAAGRDQRRRPAQSHERGIRVVPPAAEHRAGLGAALCRLRRLLRRRADRGDARHGLGLAARSRPRGRGPGGAGRATAGPVGLAHFRPFARPLAASIGGFLDDLFVDSRGARLRRGAGADRGGGGDAAASGAGR